MKVASTKDSTPGLIDVVKRNDLKIAGDEGSKYALTGTTFDLEFLRVATSSVKGNVPTSFLLPVPGSNTAILLSSIILVNHFVRKKEITAQIGLATKQMRLRSFYDSLFINREKLSDYFPRTIVTDNSISDVGSRPDKLKGKPGRLHFMSDIARLDLVRNDLNGLVIESQAAKTEQIDSLFERVDKSFPVFYITTNPSDRTLELFDKEGAIWAWNQKQVQKLVDDTDDTSVLCSEVKRLKGTTQTDFIVDGPETDTCIDGCISRLWDDLKTIQRHPGGMTFESVRWVWGVLNAYIQLAVPVEYYDKSARGAWGTSVLEKVSEKAFSFAENALKSDDREYWEIVAEDLYDLYDEFQKGNFKSEILSKNVQLICEAETKSLLLVKNRASKRATRRFFDESPTIPYEWDNYLKIATLNEHHKGKIVEKFSKIIVSGTVPMRYSGLLTLTSSDELVVLSHGPWETSRAVKQIKRANKRVINYSSGETRKEAAHTLDLSSYVDGGSEIETNVELRSSSTDGTNGLAILSGDEESGEAWDPFDVDVVGNLGDSHAEVNAPVKDSNESENLQGQVKCIKFDLINGVILFEPNTRVNRINDEGQDNVAAKSLNEGDRIVLVDRSVRRDLFDVIIDKLEQLPEFQARTKLIKEWKERVKNGAHYFDFKYSEILNAMKGTSIRSDQTIRGWVLGYIHGPRDPEDIRRFGQAVGDDFLIEHWDKIARALKTMRKHHRKIGKDLASMLENLSPENLVGEEYFDRRIGIHYSDILEAVTIETIEGKSEDLMGAPFQCVNRLLDVEEFEFIESGFND